MPGRQAKTINDALLKRALNGVARSPTIIRDRVMILLSVRAGLRACEIAGLQWSMVLTADGRVGQLIEVRDGIAKGGSGRRVPLHADLRKALLRLKAEADLSGPVIQSGRGGALRPNSVVNWFVRLYAEIGADGCSSHSGRRTFITNAARNAHKVGASLRDVQLLAGHRSLAVTQGYIDGDTDAQRRLVRAL